MKQNLLALGVITLLQYSAVCQTSNSDLDDSPFGLLKKQQRFFMYVHSGYAAALGSTFKFYSDDIRSISVDQTNNETPVVRAKYESSSKGLGQGFRYGAGFSYIVNDFINFGFDFDYFNSTISRVRDSSYHLTTQSDNQTSKYNYSQHLLTSYDATLLTFTPAFTFKAISRPRFYIYNKVGGIIVYRPNSIQKDVVQENMQLSNQNGISDSSANLFTRYEWGIKRPAFGFMSSMGAQMRLTKGIRIFGEIQFSHIVYSVRNKTMTDYIVNGQNLINTLPQSKKLTEFRSSFSTQDNTNPNEPSIALAQQLPITYLGIQAGFAFRF